MAIFTSTFEVLKQKTLLMKKKKHIISIADADDSFQTDSDIDETTPTKAKISFTDQPKSMLDKRKSALLKAYTRFDIAAHHNETNM